MELEDHHLTTIIAVIYSGKNHQWILKQLGESLLKKKNTAIYVVSV